MIDDVDYLGRKWGRHMRSQPNGWHRENWIAHEEERVTGSGHSYKSAIISSDNAEYSLAGIDKKIAGEYGRVTDGFTYANLRDLKPSGVSTPSRLKPGDSLITATFGWAGTVPSGTKYNCRIYRSEILIKSFMPEDVLRFHRAWKNLSECHQAMLWTQYVLKVAHKQKVDLLQTTNDLYAKWLDLSQRTIAREIERLDTVLSSKTFTPRSVTGRNNLSAAGPLWPCRIFSYVHKVPINDSRRDPFPICLSLTGHSNPRSPFVKGPIDSNMYCMRPNGELYAVVPAEEGLRLQNQGRLNSYLDERRSLGSEIPTKRVCNG